jgi:hypothetical protein
VNLFDRLAKGRPPSVEEKTKQQPQEQAQALLNWLQRWPKPIVSARDMRIYVKSIRDQESAIRSAQILTAQGWLIPLAAHKWQVIHKTLTPQQ